MGNATLLVDYVFTTWWSWIWKASTGSLNHAWRFIMLWIEQSDSWDWEYIFAFMVIFGLICMRGLKSKINA